MIKLQRIGRSLGDRIKSLGDSDLLSCSLHPSRSSAPVNHTPRRKKWPQRGHWRVAMDCHWNALIQCGATGIHPQGAVGAHSQSVMHIPPVKMVIGKQIYAHTQSPHLAKLGAIGQLAMLQGKAVVAMGVRLEGWAKHFQRQVNGLIAIGMGVYRTAACNAR